MTLHEQPAASAKLSDCGSYRYVLRREWWPGLPRCGWIMLNPSTADALADDPTIRRCMAFARGWGFGSIVVVNLFAFRATEPANLLHTDRPTEAEGDSNDGAISGSLAGVPLVIAGWGEPAGAALRDRVRARVARLRPRLERLPLHCLGTTIGGNPRHPLYIRGDVQPERYSLVERPEDRR